MPLQIIHQDITTMECDAIIDPTDAFYSGAGGTDRQIHVTAGPEMEKACSELEPLECGGVAVTPGYGLKCRYVIHTYGPVWEDGDCHEPMLLRSCYMNALVRAKRLGCRSVAFPLISSGTFGFPKDKVLRIASDTIADFLFSIDEDMSVFICILNRDSFELCMESDLDSFLNTRGFTVEDDVLTLRKQAFRGKAERNDAPDSYGTEADEPIAALREDAEPYNAFEYSSSYYSAPYIAPAAGEDDEPESFLYIAPLTEDDDGEEPFPPEPAAKPTLDEILKHHDDTFAVLLFKLIDSRGMDDVECYKKANISRNIFYNIRNDGSYRPSKPTVISFAIALELTIEETEKLLKSTGLALSYSDDFDLIVRFYIENGVYDVFKINEALYKYDQKPLGC